MKITQFRDDALRVIKYLGIAEADIGKTVEVLGRLLKTDAIEVSEWAVRRGKIFITFSSPIEIVGVIDHSVFLTALFQNCRIGDKTIEIESTELL